MILIVRSENDEEDLVLFIFPISRCGCQCQCLPCFVSRVRTLDGGSTPAGSGDCYQDAIKMSSRGFRNLAPTTVTSADNDDDNSNSRFDGL